VSLKTSLAGNVSYQTRDIDPDHIDGGKLVARWETERTIQDPAEHERAVKERGRARAVITGVCAKSAFGLLCPEEQQDRLESAMAEARGIVDAFNKTATRTRINIYTIVGRVAQDDVEAVRAINSEVSDLLAAMQEGVRNMDATAIRDAANKVKGLGAMLEPGASERVNAAIAVARGVARTIVKAGEQASTVIDTAALNAIAAARTAFLDLGEQQEIAEVVTTAAAVDFDPEPTEVAAPVQPASLFEMFNEEESNAL
jgi:hypothetical protein